MYFKVTNDKSKWNEFISFFPNEEKDIYFDYKYIMAYEKNGDGEANCSLFIGENGMKVLYVFMKKQVPDYGLDFRYYNISSCYGYGGPIIHSYNAKDMQNFEMCLHNWCQENSIVAEFIRFNPLLDNYDKFTKNIKVEKNRRVVIVDLLRSFEDIWKNSIISKNRNQIRKAEKSGVFIRETTNMQTFMDIYKKTMDRLHSDSYYYFSDQYYQELYKLISGNMVIFEAVYKNIIIASAIFLYMGDKMHYHLSGSLKEYLDLCPNNLLISKAIEYGSNKGYRYLNLGGGISSSDEDSLFKFKRSFSSDIKDFYIGKRIHNLEIYELLINKWEKKNNKKAKLFLQYEFI